MNLNELQIELKKWALIYDINDVPILPVTDNKTPPKDFDLIANRSRKATLKETQDWVDMYKPRGLAVITGKLSRIVVLDVDKGADFKETKSGFSIEGFSIPRTVTAVTGGGGYHFYFKIAEGMDLPTIIGLFPKVDFIARDRYVVAPPSLHESGNSYYFMDKRDIYKPMAEIPQWLLKKVQEHQSNKTTKTQSDWKTRLLGVEEGERNISMTKIVGAFLRRFPENEWKDVVWPVAMMTNEHNKPPLDSKEVESVFISLIQKERARRKQKNGGDEEKPFKPIHVSELMSMPEEQTEWLIESLLPVGSISVISGQPASFKTWIVLHIADCISSGKAVFSKFATKKGKVLIIDEENRLSLIRKRMKMLGIQENADIHVSSMHNFKIDDSEHIENLKKFCIENDVKFVSIDSLVRVHSKDENDARQIAEVFSHLKDFPKMGISILITHHHRKEFGTGKNTLSHSLRGSSDILAVVDCHMISSRIKGEKKITITQNKLRDAEEQKPFDVNIVDTIVNLSLEYEGVVDEEKLAKDEAKEEILQMLGDNSLTRGEIVKTLEEEGFGRNNTGTALKELTKDGLICCDVGPKNKKTYSLKKADIPEEENPVI